MHIFDRVSSFPGISARFARAVLWSTIACLAGCTSYSGSSLVPGNATREDARALMGPPATVHSAPPGAAYAESWEYPRGPAGRHTYMARFDAQGRLVAMDQVLTLGTIARIRPGQDTRDDVRHLLGRPATVAPARPDGEIWDYASLENGVGPRKMRLLVTFDRQGTVVSAGQMMDPEEYGVGRRR